MLSTEMLLCHRFVLEKLWRAIRQVFLQRWVLQDIVPGFILGRRWLLYVIAIFPRHCKHIGLPPDLIDGGWIIATELDQFEDLLGFKLGWIDFL